MTYTYPACFYREPDGRWSVEVPDFPLATCGGSFDEAARMAADAVGGRILSDLADGGPLPVPSDICSVRPDDDDDIVRLVTVELNQHPRAAAQQATVVL
jgi:predicted RNase H-like HicB family nuclease